MTEEEKSAWLRDLAAIQFLAAMIAHGSVPIKADACRAAYEFADLLLKARTH